MYDYSYSVMRFYEINVLGKLVFWDVFYVELIWSKVKEIFRRDDIRGFSRSKKFEEVIYGNVSVFGIFEDIRDEVGGVGFLLYVG